MIVARRAIRLSAGRRSTASASSSPALDLVTQVLLVVLGLLARLLAARAHGGISLGTSPSWSDLAFALPLAMLAYTGLETVANYAEEVRGPGVDLPRSLFGAIGTVVVVYVLVAMVGLSAFPAAHGTTELGERVAEVAADGDRGRIGQELPWSATSLRIYVGLSAC